MSVLSRRQKDSLLNDVARMINNNNHTAFANHAKISESVGNGDMKILVDAPKKEWETYIKDVLIKEFDLKIPDKRYIYLLNYKRK